MQFVGVERLIDEIRQGVHGGDLSGLAPEISGGGQVENEKEERRYAIQETESQCDQRELVQGVAGVAYVHEMGGQKPFRRQGARQQQHEQHGEAYARRLGPERQKNDPRHPERIQDHKNADRNNRYELHYVGVFGGVFQNGHQRKDAHGREHEIPGSLALLRAFEQHQVLKAQQQVERHKRPRETDHVHLDHGGERKRNAGFVFEPQQGLIDGHVLRGAAGNAHQHPDDGGCQRAQHQRSPERFERADRALLQEIRHQKPEQRESGNDHHLVCEIHRGVPGRAGQPFEYVVRRGKGETHQRGGDESEAMLSVAQRYVDISLSASENPICEMTGHRQIAG